MATLLWLVVFLGVVAGCDRESFPVSDSVITRGNGGDPGSLDPALAQDIHAFSILADLYEGLVNTSPAGDIVPGVAEYWQVSPDGRVYRFELRNTAKWSNGDEVTAHDFVRAFRRVANPHTASAYSFLLDPIRHFPEVQNGMLPVGELGIRAVDDYVLEIELRDPAPHLPAILAMPVAFPVHRSAIGFNAHSDPDLFVGNGAYRLVEHSIGGPTKLRRNLAYWDAASVSVEEIIYLPIVDALTELNMYRSGEIDITHTVPPQHVKALRDNSSSELRVAPYLALYYLAFDLTEPPLDNPRLRKALNMAIDRETLVMLIGRGEQPAYGIVPPNVAEGADTKYTWHSLTADERRKQARALYHEAGYNESSPLQIKYTYDNEDIHEQVALAVSSMWREVLGVDVTLEKKEWQFFLDTRERRSDWQVMRFAWFGDYNHASTFTDIFRSNDPQNLPAYQNQEYDQLLADARVVSDPPQNTSKLRAAQRLLLEDHAIAPLYFFVSKHLVRTGIAGFEHNALDRHPSKYLSLQQKP